MTTQDKIPAVQREYVATLMDGRTYRITGLEHQAIITREKGMVYISRLDTTINRAIVASIEPVSSHEAQARARATSGRLHDGTRVVKKFGTWVNADDPNVRIDPAYYPEIAKDEIMTEEEYKAQKSKKALPSPQPDTLPVARNQAVLAPEELEGTSGSKMETKGL